MSAGTEKDFSDSNSDGEVSEGSLKYTREQGGNDSPISYQEASGAPVETKSPLGYTVGGITVIFLNLSKMIGTGIFSTRKSIQGSSLPKELPDF